MADKIDLYNDRGKLLESDVDIMDIAPTKNDAIKEIIDDTKKSVAINLKGIQKALSTGKMGGKAGIYLDMNSIMTLSEMQIALEIPLKNL